MKKGTMLDTRSKGPEFKQMVKVLRKEKNPKVEYPGKITKIPYDGNVERDEEC